MTVLRTIPFPTSCLEFAGGDALLFRELIATVPHNGSGMGKSVPSGKPGTGRLRVFGVSNDQIFSHMKKKDARFRWILLAFVRVHFLSSYGFVRQNSLHLRFKSLEVDFLFDRLGEFQ